MSEKPCPICMGAYHKTDLSLDVCEFHQNWLVVVCTHCGQKAFSDHVGGCLLCESDYGHLIAGKKDPRAYLREIGQEDTW